MKTEHIAAAIAAVTAVNAAGGAWYGLAGAENWPREWLDGTPFDGYAIPSAVLGAAVGGSSAIAAVETVRGGEHAALATAAAGAVLTGWIVAQVGLIGYRSPLQPIFAGVGVTLIGLGRRIARED